MYVNIYKTTNPTDEHCSRVNNPQQIRTKTAYFGVLNLNEHPTSGGDLFMNSNE